MSVAPVLKMEGISKSFPGVKALDHVSFEVERGEIHCLVGQNGAGKSTLIKILAGAYTPDSGSIFLEGRSVALANPHAALQMGISVLYQEFALNPHFDVAANIFMGREPRNGLGVVDYKKMFADAAKLLEPFEVHIDIRKKIRNLSVADQQIVSLAKALSFQSKVIVFDEPSAVLTSEELHKLYQIIRNLKKQGVGIIYISHRLEEIFLLGDRVTVLRDGKTMATKPMKEVDEAMLVRMMIGRDLQGEFPERGAKSAETILELKDCQVGNLVGPCSLSLQKGEIVGIFGLVGAGRTELVKGIFGALPFTRGQVLLNGQPIQIGSPAQAIAKGIGLVPESRKTEGLVLGLSVEKNLTICLWQLMQRSGFILWETIRKISHEFVDRFTIKTPSIHQEVKNLSGGNQQKVVLGKWLARKCNLLILDEPTRGIDIGAKREIYQLIAQLAGEGLGLIVISSELSEVMNLTHRILVMRKGRIVGEYATGTVDEETILAKAMGVKINGN